MTEPTHDPVDMIKVSPPSQAEQELARVDGYIDTATETLKQIRPGGEDSWGKDHQMQRVQALAQLAQAQAQYAIALQLREIQITLETSLDRIVDHLSDISGATDMPGWVDEEP